MSILRLYPADIGQKSRFFNTQPAFILYKFSLFIRSIPNHLYREGDPVGISSQCQVSENDNVGSMRVKRNTTIIMPLAIYEKMQSPVIHRSVANIPVTGGSFSTDFGPFSGFENWSAQWLFRGTSLTYFKKNND